jgi:hypothetical protein
MMRLLFSRRAEKQLYDRKSQPSRIRTPEGKLKAQSSSEVEEQRLKEQAMLFMNEA